MAEAHTSKEIAIAMRIIQAGLGGWGRNWYTQVVSPEKRVQVVAFVEKVPKVKAEAAVALGVSPDLFYGSINEALSATEAEAVLITANLPGHGPLARAALDAGLHVLVEKPFVPTVREAGKLAETAERKGLVLMVSQNYRYYPAVRAVRKIIGSGSLGQVGAVSIDFRRYANHGEPTRKHYHIDHPLLLDMAVHQMDLLRYVLGCEARQVVCWPSNPVFSKFRDPPTASALISFENGVLATYRGSWIAHETSTPWAGNWTVECEKGAIRWASRAGFTGDGDSVTIEHEGKGGTKTVSLPSVRHVGRAGCLDTFIKAVAGRVTPETLAYDNINTLKLVYGTIAACTTGRVVRLWRSGAKSGEKAFRAA
jgi:predicted dehydrogenase